MKKKIPEKDLIAELVKEIEFKTEETPDGLSFLHGFHKPTGLIDSYPISPANVVAEKILTKKCVAEAIYRTIYNCSIHYIDLVRRAEEGNL